MFVEGLRGGGQWVLGERRGDGVRVGYREEIIKLGWGDGEGIGLGRGEMC